MCKNLNENELEKIYGGALNWELFSQKYLVALKTAQDITLTEEHKKLIEAIKEKNYVQVAIIATPLIAKDPLVARIAMECR